MASDGDSTGLTLWSGWDVRGGAAKSGATEDFARPTAQGAGGEVRYELLAVAARGFRPPRFLTAADLPEEGSDGDGHGAQRAAETDYEGLRQTWSLLYRRLTETRSEEVVPYAIYLLGVNPPDGVTEKELEVFNAFYTSVHLPEVAERRRALRAVRYELAREVRAPYQGAPRFMAVYEVDEKEAAHRRHTGPPYVRGPEVWQRHTTPWRLWYRRLIPSG
jgi:hypothetical protein